MTEQEAFDLLAARDRELADHRGKLSARDGTPDTLQLVLAKAAEALGEPMPEAMSRVLGHQERERRDEDARRREAEAARHARLTKALACVPPKARKVVLEQVTLERTEAVQAALEWERADQYRVVLLRGGVGVGKSIAAAAAAYASAARGRRHISWHRPNDFVSAMLHAYDPTAPKLGLDLVVIDDLGRETKHDFDEALCAFFDETETRCVLTTNLGAQEFKDRYDVRVLDRLRECAVAIACKGTSRRAGGGVGF